MARNLMLSTALCIIMAACTQIDIAFTPTTVLTDTPVPIPTNTLTLTLEPWMQSLPKDIVSVEVDGEQIVGLDSQGNELMFYDLHSDEWISLTEQESVEKENIEVQDRPIKLITSAEFVDVDYSGVNMNGMFGIDETLSSKYAGRKISMPPELAADLLFEAAYTVYANHKAGEGAPVDKETYKQMLLEVQAGERDPSELAVNLCDYVAPAIGTEAGQKCRTAVFFPGAGAEKLEEGEYAVNSLSLSFVNAVGRVKADGYADVRFDMPNFVLNPKSALGHGWEAVFDEETGEFITKMGMSYKIGKGREHQAIASATAENYENLKQNDGQARIRFTPNNYYFNIGLGYIERGFAVR